MADLSKAIEGVKLADDILQIRRIVTGHDETGIAIFVEDKICENRFAIGGCEHFGTVEMWRQTETPARNDGDYKDTTAGGFNINPDPQGNVFRIMQFPPDGELGMKEDGVTPIPPMMHRTASLDYAVILEGEVYAVLDGAETLMKKGDVLIQRGTMHAWSNRSDKPCVILFVLCAAEREEGKEYK
jgi:mannose-6-phosphate isomerase-like protein (cupin superfamily)